MASGKCLVLGSWWADAHETADKKKTVTNPPLSHRLRGVRTKGRHEAGGGHLAMALRATSFSVSRATCPRRTSGTGAVGTTPRRRKTQYSASWTRGGVGKPRRLFGPHDQTSREREVGTGLDRDCSLACQLFIPFETEPVGLTETPGPGAPPPPPPAATGCHRPQALTAGEMGPGSTCPIF